MGNTVNPSSGTGSNSLRVTIVPVNAQTYSVLTAEGGGLSDSVTFEQQKKSIIDPDGSAVPIGEDITYSQDADKFEYTIYVEGEESPIYTGYAYRCPGSPNIEIELNNILSDYLKNHISFREGLSEMDGYVKKFVLSTNVNNGYKIVTVYKSWKKPETPILNDPISNVIDPRQYHFVNFIDGYGDFYFYRDGYELDSLGVVCGGAYVAPRVGIDCGESYKYDIRQIDKGVVGEIEFVFKETNKNYALYYVNAYGGWDSLAIRGNVTQTDNIQSHTYKNKTNGKVKYLNTITPTWQLYTDDMNDGSKMHHLLESTEVYLHNLETDEIVPVVITDSNCVYKTYANQGNSRFHYVINVEAANYKIRK